MRLAGIIKSDWRLAAIELSVASLFVASILLVTAKPRHSGVSAEMAKIGENIREIKSGLRRLRKDCGRYPTLEEGLSALSVAPVDLAPKWRGPYIRPGCLNDPWGHRYSYTPSKADQESFTVRSLGSDGKPGGNGDAIDFDATG